MGTIHNLVDILRLEQMPMTQPPRSITSPERYIWEEISGQLVPTRAEAVTANNNQAVPSEIIDFGSGCREMYTASMDYPSQASHIAFYFVSLGGAAYAPPPMFLCGIEVFHRNPDDGQFLLGYRSPIRRIHILDPEKSVTGFNVTVGSRGISSIQIQFVEGFKSCWYQGNSGDENPESMRAVGPGRICGIKASFDGLKIVSLGVAKLQVPEPGTSLKESGIWYPEIPRFPVCLNEEILPNLAFYSTGYFPLFWVRFGGARGEYLESLKSIDITIVDGVWGIEFAYCDGRAPEKLGRHPYDIDLDPEIPNILTIEVDGPRGERISSISLWYDSDTFAQGQINKPCGIEIHTNWGNSRLCGDGGTVVGYLKKDLEPEEGTVITGFYANQLPTAGFTTIGLMSERVEFELGPCSLASLRLDC
ncbi:unnamed protein product [Clonostachys byssicola]|uniref:DUF7600 domain-containing protein n=1 Tax=Clonostachys byssicola TaxID=160290 RepID=A0A9N9Y3P0_9HYPO|nr:unnamed protein product [Clonostachys byssicola]